MTEAAETAGDSQKAAAVLATVEISGPVAHASLFPAMHNPGVTRPFQTIAALSIFILGSPAWGQEVPLDFEGLSYSLHKPTGSARGGFPLIVSMHGSGGASEKPLLQADFQKKYPCYALAPKSKAPWAGSDQPGAAMPKDFDLSSQPWGSSKTIAGDFLFQAELPDGSGAGEVGVKSGPSRSPCRSSSVTPGCIQTSAFRPVNRSES